MDPDEIARFFGSSMEEAIEEATQQPDETPDTDVDENSVEQQAEADHSPTGVREKSDDFDPEIYKKWHRTGFISVTGWKEHRKVKFDIGTTDGKTLVDSAESWTNGIEILTYLHAVFIGAAERLYPANPKIGAPTPESFVKYGGSGGGGSAISRILKIHRSTDKGGNEDPNTFVIKCGHFTARTSSTGAFIPDMTKELKRQQIKMTRQDMAVLYESLDLWMLAATLGPITRG